MRFNFALVTLAFLSSPSLAQFWNRITPRSVVNSYFNSFNSAKNNLQKSGWSWPCFYCSDQKSSASTDNAINQNAINPYEQGGTCFYKGNLINSPYITDLRVSNRVLQKCKLAVGTCPVQFVNCKWVYVFGRRSVPLKTTRYIPSPESEPERLYISYPESEPERSFYPVPERSLPAPEPLLINPVFKTFNPERSFPAPERSIPMPESGRKLYQPVFVSKPVPERSLPAPERFSPIPESGPKMYQPVFRQPETNEKLYISAPVQKVPENDGNLLQNFQSLFTGFQPVPMSSVVKPDRPEPFGLSQDVFNQNEGQNQDRNQNQVQNSNLDSQLMFGSGRRFRLPKSSSFFQNKK